MQVSGEVIYLYLYDLGGYLDLISVRKTMKVTSEDLRRELKTPSYLSITPQPLSYELSTDEVIIEGNQRRMRVEVWMHSVGALTILFRIQFDGKLRDLMRYSSADRLDLIQDSKHVNLRKLSRRYSEELRERLANSLSSRYEREPTPEEYTIFCISSLPQGVDVTRFAGENRNVVTAILREIDNIDSVSESECDSALRYSVTYSSNYHAIVDWASSMIIQTSRDYEDYLLTIGLANLQLLQLRTFDGHIDRLIEKAYSHVAYVSKPPFPAMLSTRSLSNTVMDIAEMRVEMTDVLDKVVNITKFFGDYTLARLYEHLSIRLHLKEWHQTVSRKLEILGDLYKVASDKVASRQMLVLETLVVLLFVFEILVTITQWFK